MDPGHIAENIIYPAAAVIIIDLTHESDDEESCIRRVVDTIFAHVCPIDLVSSDDDIPDNTGNANFSNTETNAHAASCAAAGVADDATPPK